MIFRKPATKISVNRQSTTDSRTLHGRDLAVSDIQLIFLFSGQARRTLFDVLRDENNFTERCEKRKNLKNRHSSEEISALSKTAPMEATLEVLQQENKG